jgi:DNA excision repair protein ERCC-3
MSGSWRTEMPDTWDSEIHAAQSALDELDHSISYLAERREKAVAAIEKALRSSGAPAINLAAIAATVERPYTLMPINEHEAWLIHWCGVKMPIFGWVVSQEDAFIKARVSRSMDLIAPLPGWIRSELGWKPPAHKALIDGDRTSIRITEGDEGDFRRRYGKHLGQKTADGSFKIKSGDAWIKLVAQLIKDGILPYTPIPVAAENWDTQAKSPINLRTYQSPIVKQFLDKGSILINIPPGAGKTYIASYVLAHFVGKVLLLADSTVLVEQWRDAVKTYAPQADVTISTYQGAGKYLDKEWDLLIPDEAQRLPANTFSRLAFVKTKYRMGLSGTAWREDGRIFMIAALCGFPVHIPWAELIAAGVLKKPRVVVYVVPNDAAKTRHVKVLLAQRKGQALIYCDWLEQGRALANELNVPFISGASTNKLTQIREADVCVVSRVADRGIDLSDLNLVVEVGFMGGSREQYAQRLGRLLHSTFGGLFATVFTEQEALQYRSRIFGAEAEMAGQVDIEFIYVDGTQTKSGSGIEVYRQKAKRDTRRNLKVLSTIPAAKEPDDNIARIMAIPSITAKLAQAAKSIEPASAAWLRKAFRTCFVTSCTPEEVVIVAGMSGDKTISRAKTACNALVRSGLFSKNGSSFIVNTEVVERLRALST